MWFLQPVVPPGKEQSNTCKNQGQDFWSSQDSPVGTVRSPVTGAHRNALSSSEHPWVFSALPCQEMEGTSEILQTQMRTLLCWGLSNRADKRKTCTDTRSDVQTKRNLADLPAAGLPLLRHLSGETHTTGPCFTLPATAFAFAM